CRSSMTPERWTRIKTLFHEAQAQEPAQWADFLARMAGDDTKLADEVLGLLAEDAKAGGILGAGARRGDRGIVGASAKQGDRRFVIEKELGRGGMGRVVAARDEKLGRQV